MTCLTHTPEMEAVSRFRDIGDAELKERLFGYMRDDLGVSRHHLLVSYEGNFGSWASRFKRWSWERFGFVPLIKNIDAVHLSSIITSDDQKKVRITYRITTKDAKTHALVCRYETKGTTSELSEEKNYEVSNGTVFEFSKTYVPHWEEPPLEDGERVVFEGDEAIVSHDFADLNSRFALVKE